LALLSFFFAEGSLGMPHDLSVIGLIGCNIAALGALLWPRAEPGEPSFPTFQRSCEIELKELLQTRADLAWFRSLVLWIAVTGIFFVTTIGAVLAYGHSFYVVQIHPICSGAAVSSGAAATSGFRKGKGQLQ
jgi:hypothetical protein